MIDAYAVLDRFERGLIPVHEVPAALLSWFNAGYRQACDTHEQRALTELDDELQGRARFLARVELILHQLPERTHA